MDILFYAACGFKEREIAVVLGLSMNTIGVQKTLLFQRWRARNMTHCITIACSHGWIDPKTCTEVPEKAPPRKAGGRKRPEYPSLVDKASRMILDHWRGQREGRVVQ